LNQTQTQITQLLQKWQEGNDEALETLMPLVYAELKRLAGSYLRRERPDHTLQSAALVNEAYLRLVDQTQTQWQNKAHFFGIAAQMMRRILADHARGHNAAKRGAGMPELELNEAVAQAQTKSVDLLDLEEALQKLEKLDPEVLTKSGIMVGLGEEMDEVKAVMRDQRSWGVDILTIGQYLQPSKKHMPISRYYTMEEFAELRDYGKEIGFKWVESNPLVRSSYHAAEQVRALSVVHRKLYGENAVNS